MGRRKFYVTVDTETCTLPFANYLCKNAREKQKIAIAKPLVYDLGWVVTDTQGNIIKRRNYLIQEIFFVPNVFNTAYYKDKRPIYMKLLEEDLIQVATWNEAIEELIADMEYCDMVCAYNACFDFKKAIPFTEQYIQHLYSNDYTIWEEQQKKRCEQIIRGTDESENPDYLEPHFFLRDIEFPLCDLWGVACERLINIDKYRNYCLENSLITASAFYFKSSAETSFQYIMNRYDFIEDHTALSDAEIESQILAKALKKGKIEPSIKPFPFRELGTTVDYVRAKKPKYKPIVKQAFADYIESNDGEDKAEWSNYWRRVLKAYDSL